jgi:TolB protein
VSLTENREDDIYTINPDGSGKSRVTNTENTDEEWLDYSPDGKKIAYTDYRQGPGTAIYTISVRGGGKSKVTGGADPSYSPDGKRIAYSAYDGHDQEIYTMNVGGGVRFKLQKTERTTITLPTHPTARR